MEYNYIVSATVLHSNGFKDIKTAADAAKAIEPLVHSFANAGLLAKLIFSSGIIGLGFSANTCAFCICIVCGM